ncbi:hypothetical protein AAMO2058_000113800 [Amorphochlora amoebiformis]
MGNEMSLPKNAMVYRSELLKLSWRMVLSVDSYNAVKGETDVLSQSCISQETDLKDLSTKPFHEVFEARFMKYCPDLEDKFPTDYALIVKMIQNFISKATNADGKVMKVMAVKFAKTHAKYNLTEEHFQGFSEALIDTLKGRLGKFGTMQLMKIWREVTEALVGIMFKEYTKIRKGIKNLKKLGNR